MQTPNEVEPCSTFPFRDIAVQKVIKDADPYILDLVKRIVAVSVGSVEIVKGLPDLEEVK